MATQPRLPARFPVGTHYIVEGEPAKGGELRIVSRYLVMPSGVRYDLMNAAETAGNRARKSSPPRPKALPAVAACMNCRRVVSDMERPSQRGEWKWGVCAST